MTEEVTPPEGKSSFSGIPEAQFIEDVDTFMKGEDSAEAKLKTIDENHQKYKFMENSLVTRRKRLKGQVPDIKVIILISSKSQSYIYSLSEFVGYDQETSREERN